VLGSNMVVGNLTWVLDTPCRSRKPQKVKGGMLSTWCNILPHSAEAV